MFTENSGITSDLDKLRWLAQSKQIGKYTIEQFFYILRTYEKLIRDSEVTLKAVGHKISIDHPGY